MIAVIDYKAGNTRSVMNALDRLSTAYVLTDDIDTIISATKVILPGVGHARFAMDSLREKGLDEVIPKLKQPVLGICLGMQLLLKYSDEGKTDCLGIMEGKVSKFNSETLLVPQVGWNSIEFDNTHRLFTNVPPSAHVYLVHSYYADVHEYTIATSCYGTQYTVGLQKENFYGLQFHPEKSGPVGETILKNFINIES